MEHIDEEVKKQKYSLMADQLIKNLKARRYETYYCSDKEEAKKKVLELLTPGCSIGWGGSMTFEQLELKDILREKGFRLIDRDQAKTKEEKRELTVKASQADVFFASANAIDMKGEIFETDGMGGRVAAIVYEAKEVILLIGMNKVVQSQEEAVERVKNYASPLNALRLKKEDLACTKIGQCVDCLSPNCICAFEVKLRLSYIPNRIKVILIGEDLGY